MTVDRPSLPATGEGGAETPSLKRRRALATLQHATLERASENGNAATLVAYFVGEPTRAEVVAAAKSVFGKLPLSVDTEDPFFGWKEHPTPVSVKAGLRRYEVFPTG